MGARMRNTVMLFVTLAAALRRVRRKE